MVWYLGLFAIGIALIAALVATGIRNARKRRYRKHR
jgi:hypothetical protein